jgi:hypothetical protein
VIALVLAAVLLQGPAVDLRVDSLLAAGKQHFAGRIVGRYPALEAFRSAARLAPTNPEPLYWQMKVGFYLGGDEGDVIAREAILKIFALDPEYEDVWARFLTVYQNRNIWRRADRALALHPENRTALRWRGELAIALEEAARADSLLAIVLADDPSDIGALVLRAEASFVAGRDSAGYRWYDEALARVDHDTAGVLWSRVWMIASPEEIAAQDTLTAAGAHAFFTRFWARRDPNLITPENERIAEHFRRVAYVRRYFRLLHPLSLYMRSPKWRALVSQTQRDFLQSRGQQAGDPYPGLETDRLIAATRQLPDVPAGAGTSSAATGFDARGLIYLRHGAPDQMLRGYFDPLHPFGAAELALDVEGWLYRTPEGFLSLGFRRASGSSDPNLAGGDFIFVPANRHQARSTALALRSDRTDTPAPLPVRAWTAVYDGERRGETDVYFKIAGAEDSVAAALWDANGTTVRAVSAGKGLLRLTVPAGRFDLGIDVTAAGQLGRLRRELSVPLFTSVALTVSSLALAPGAAVTDRETVLRAMPADLAYPAGTPLTSYAELYGLSADASGRTHYRLRYAFTPLQSFAARLWPGGPRPVVFEFERAGTRVRDIERLVIQPDKLPAGRYRVTLSVTDLSRNVKSESVAVEIEIR